MSLKDSVNLIQGYYHFLYMGKYLDSLIKHKDFGQQVKPITIDTGSGNNFHLTQSRLQKLFHAASENPDKDNIFGYMVELNAVRGIIFTMRELIENSESFKRFLQERISSQYFPFEQIIRFIRNVLAHSYDAQLTIKKDDFIHQKTYRSSKGVDRIHFVFAYDKYRAERTGDKTYGVDIKINFKKLKAGTPLHTCISRHQLYLLCELCYNITKLYNASTKSSTRKERNTTSPKKAAPTKTTPTKSSATTPKDKSPQPTKTGNNKRKRTTNTRKTKKDSDSTPKSKSTTTKSSSQKKTKKSVTKSPSQSTKPTKKTKQQPNKKSDKKTPSSAKK